MARLGYRTGASNSNAPPCCFNRAEFRRSEKGHGQQGKHTYPYAWREPHSMDLRYGRQDDADKQQPKHKLKPGNNPSRYPNTRGHLDKRDLTQENKHCTKTGYTEPPRRRLVCCGRVLIALT